MNWIASIIIWHHDIIYVFLVSWLYMMRCYSLNLMDWQSQYRLPTSNTAKNYCTHKTVALVFVYGYYLTRNNRSYAMRNWIIWLFYITRLKNKRKAGTNIWLSWIQYIYHFPPQISQPWNSKLSSSVSSAHCEQCQQTNSNLLEICILHAHMRHAITPISLTASRIVHKRRRDYYRPFGE